MCLILSGEGHFFKHVFQVRGKVITLEIEVGRIIGLIADLVFKENQNRATACECHYSRNALNTQR